MRGAKYEYFIIYFIARYHLVWQWKTQTETDATRHIDTQFVVSSLYFLVSMGKMSKNRINFLQFSKHEATNERDAGTRNIVLVAREQIKQIYICELFSVHKMSWHWKRMAVFTQLDNNADKLFSTEIRRLSPAFLASRSHSVRNLIYVSRDLL